MQLCVLGFGLLQSRNQAGLRRCRDFGRRASCVSHKLVSHAKQVPQDIGCDAELTCDFVLPGVVLRCPKVSHVHASDRLGRILPLQCNLLTSWGIAPTTIGSGSMSVIAFHEKAGRSQVGWWFDVHSFFFPPSSQSPCFHAHSRGAILVARCRLGVLGSAGAAI